MARIAGVNLPTNKRVVIALQYIHGIGQKKAAKTSSKKAKKAVRKAAKSAKNSAKTAARKGGRKASGRKVRKGARR